MNPSIFLLPQSALEDEQRLALKKPQIPEASQSIGFSEVHSAKDFTIRYRDDGEILSKVEKEF